MAGQRVDGQPLDAGAFRQVIGRFMSGVVVITATHQGERRGMTVSAVASLSLDPPMIVTCLNAASSTQEAIRRAGAFAVNILAEDQEHLAGLFARPGADPFLDLPCEPGITGAPILAGALAVLECQIAQEVRGGSHRVLLANVVRASAGEGSPLAYFRGRFGRIELIQDAEAYQRLRDLILTRQVSADERLDVERLAGQLTIPPSAVQYALTRLVTENLVIREDRGHVVKPLDVATSNGAHDARMAIELGVAEMTVGHLGHGQLAELRRLAQATIDVLGRGDGDTDGIAAYALANQEFHRFLVATAGVDALSAVYEQLSIADLISRALRTRDEIEGILAREHLDLVQAYERADLDGVRDVIFRHTAHAKQTQQRGIERAGGQL
jgi:flavin reductase (DIM6/NTAB) family NADH-FMN oxidoreductase RutF/DNA-binding GntR family transcriptional regulator